MFRVEVLSVSWFGGIVGFTRARANALFATEPSRLVPLGAGYDSNDATSARRDAPEDFAAGLLPLDGIKGKPLTGRRVAVIKETLGEGVDASVQAAVQAAMRHLKALGAEIAEVRRADVGS